MPSEPIFIVGVPRSGTTLLAAMLAAHSRISCGPETHFFRRLAKTDASVMTAPDSWPATAVEFVCSISHAGFAGHEQTLLTQKYHLERSDIEGFLRNQPPSVAAILSSLTEQQMLRSGKQRWAEKTPDHLEHMDRIRMAFPNAPIVRIIRDPRDVALSLTKVPWGANTFVEGLLYWKRLHEAGERMLAADRASYTLRFEDLLSAPQDSLRKLCAFLGEAFENTMLDTSVSGKQVNSRSVPWKQKASEPIDTGRMYIWRNELNPTQNILAEALVGDWLKAYDYPRDRRFSHLGVIHPATVPVTDYVHGLEAVAADGIRFWKETPDERPSARVYLGDPGDYAWLSDARLSRVRNTFAITVDIMKTSRSAGRVFWLPRQQNDHWSGYLGAILKTLLAGQGTIVRPTDGETAHVAIIS